MSLCKHRLWLKQPTRLSNHYTQRNNNFNLLRMLAATCVLISHAYPISLGAQEVEPLEEILGMSLGYVSVLIFFSISGFFITKSFLFRATWQRFLLARALRLFPALFVALTITVIVSGVFLTEANPVIFWKEAPAYFLQNITLIRLYYPLPGVFQDNPYGTAINGSLWTLIYEVTCYMGVFLAGILGILHRPRHFTLCLGLVIMFYLAMPHLTVHPRLAVLSRLALPFFIGVSFLIWRDIIPLSKFVAVILGLLAWAVHGTDAFNLFFLITLSYSIFVIGYWQNTLLQTYNRLGDYSYGTYIYAFPIQQIVASSGVTDPIVNIAISLPTTLFCAVLSWHFVERVALDLKPRLHLNLAE